MKTKGGGGGRGGGGGGYGYDDGTHLKPSAIEAAAREGDFRWMDGKPDRRGGGGGHEDDDYDDYDDDDRKRGDTPRDYYERPASSGGGGGERFVRDRKYNRRGQEERGVEENDATMRGTMIKSTAGDTGSGSPITRRHQRGAHLDTTTNDDDDDDDDERRRDSRRRHHFYDDHDHGGDLRDRERAWEEDGEEEEEWRRRRQRTGAGDRDGGDYRRGRPHQGGHRGGDHHSVGRARGQRGGRGHSSPSSLDAARAHGGAGAGGSLAGASSIHIHNHYPTTATTHQQQQEREQLQQQQDLRRQSHPRRRRHPDHPHHPHSHRAEMMESRVMKDGGDQRHRHDLDHDHDGYYGDKHLDASHSPRAVAGARTGAGDDYSAYAGDDYDYAAASAEFGYFSSPWTSDDYADEDHRRHRRGSGAGGGGHADKREEYSRGGVDGGDIGAGTTPATRVTTNKLGGGQSTSSGPLRGEQRGHASAAVSPGGAYSRRSRETTGGDYNYDHNYAGGAGSTRYSSPRRDGEYHRRAAGYSPGARVGMTEKHSSRLTVGTGGAGGRGGRGGGAEYGADDAAYSRGNGYLRGDGDAAAAAARMASAYDVDPRGSYPAAGIYPPVVPSLRHPPVPVPPPPPPMKLPVEPLIPPGALPSSSNSVGAGVGAGAGTAAGVGSGAPRGESVGKYTPAGPSVYSFVYSLSTHGFNTGIHVFHAVSLIGGERRL